ncbi:MAG: alpha-ketoglutarate-dependent dioxygenase AlkB [Ketobacteraceae bacterium]|nr:alpha-ketoglutarate-dependent dioxygenase AlkB [Ketobacteraceae bacterium]
MQTDLFDNRNEVPPASPGPERILLDRDGKSFVLLHRGFYPHQKADSLFERLSQEIPWRQDNIRIAGKTLPVPRLQAWFGDPGADYGYSGIRLTAQPFTSTLTKIRQDTEQLGNSAGAGKLRFNSLLANLYRDGSDGVGWHSDDEPELGINPVIASVSFGGTRRFSLKPKDKSRRPLHIELYHGDIMIMSGETQHHWVHQVPKTRAAVPPRINLTFRKIHVK